MHKERYIGIMSGTSLDGVDVVLCEIDASACALIASLEYPLSLELKSEILMMIEGNSTLEQVGQLDHRLGVLFAGAVDALLTRHNIDATSIRAIGLHGQTLWHAPQNGVTMQLGDPNILTSQTGIPVVSDFRRKDVALGGQGAPFAPAFHEFIFGSINASVCIVNIGGMANITVLGETLVGYDTGCGNVLLDSWIAEHQGSAYDKEGAWAKTGSVDERLLDAMRSDSYFKLSYPKSTGREKFNKVWLDDMLTRRGSGVCSLVLEQDVQRTLLELTALSISNEVLRFNTDVLILCGGGAKNCFLVERLKALMPNTEVRIADYADELEAMTFAWLAYKRIHKEKVNLKDVTGACENTILGGIYE
ncbi:MAG TPA: anhydro-N-acetylmuramic acid kinase [Sulfurovum sp.]|jgi:anhydro-N-acetylmuramic acid kinase|nr:MAG: anhydro-N-acetylmuramic acid kinase [Sulfurovum sp. 35-42-20]OYY56140.1 MAG: anhydro-N-acetylmuramic acid kinase [Sulfurovum sp. 28-43-6]OYZ25181.1 MAG: anhydro-N-acetylmuramic acid kinase [Sulfurovum sp. 16-42-52]OYZ48619.1 MAG: anhydro-N-acetylmuramic acid kinase [Sulfurovum sp. 24-42-9]OZA45339.1 MAG: anhydro-N-acetylmuramic acid kinase [Sulfurovum sp. 17-42-90]OZA61026.1 MAG: anhydro-N-acetylmuramic acid kinase [Sulfurovum sp. 39-42-12]HQR74381.1 anhydro-N-acetylmuramic acid kinas